MIHKYYSLLIAIGCSAYFLTGCSKDCNKPDDTKNNDLVGTWKWVRTDGGIGNNIHNTPASTGKNVELVLTSNFKYSLLTDGITTSEGTFSLPVRNCIHDGSNKRVIDFSETSVTDQMVESIGNNSLTLSDDYLDGTVSEFSRN